MSQWVQMDLLDLIAEAEAKQPTKKHQLHPALESWQSEYDRLIDQGAHELCKGWKQAEKNEAGVYVENVHTYVAGSRKDVYLELRLALKNGTIYGSVSLESNKDGNYGAYSPVDDDSEICLLAYDTSWNMDCELTASLNGSIIDDNNVSDDAKERMLKLVSTIVKKAIEDMK